MYKNKIDTLETVIIPYAQDASDPSKDSTQMRTDSVADMVVERIQEIEKRA